jgi:hypothetical protein
MASKASLRRVNTRNMVLAVQNVSFHLGFTASVLSLAPSSDLGVPRRLRSDFAVYCMLPVAGRINRHCKMLETPVYEPMPAP